MKINVTQQITRLEGDPIIVSDQTCPACGQPVKGEILTLRAVCGRALIFRDPQEKMSYETQIIRYRLANRLYQNDQISLDVAEAGLLQTLIAAIYSPLITGQAGIMLEG